MDLVSNNCLPLIKIGHSLECNHSKRLHLHDFLPWGLKKKKKKEREKKNDWLFQPPPAPSQRKKKELLAK